MREYELWLDESGDFEKESQTGENIPSLVGGILIEKGQLTEREITQLVNAEANAGNAHATSMDKKKVKRIVLPALESICHRHGKLVYFENKERLTTYSNRDLYLRVLAAGLVQLMQYLGKDGSFGMDVTIAVRYVPESVETPMFTKIEEEEYAEALRRYIREQWVSGNFEIDTRTRLNLTILSARRERRLQLADYACNARFTRKKKKFTEEMRLKLEALFDEDYIYSVHVNTPENYVLSQLAVGNVANALVEFYTSREQGKLRDVEEHIFFRLQEMSYRLARLQINQFTTHLVGVARAETDFERSEEMLKRVLGEFFPKLETLAIHVQTDEAKFKLQWCLVDMYLREGDIYHAEEVLASMRELVQGMNYRAESLRFLYLYLDRKALFDINCMDYEQAVRTMQESIQCMENVRSVLDCEDVIQNFFGKREICSEWLGNAYCMKIYAEMFLQRFQPDLYPAIKRDIDIALSQYEYSGELERNQQYRAHVEMEAGHYREALEWLFRTQNLDLDADILENCVDYLHAAVSEDTVSRMYYLMYYVEIMAAAQQAGETELAEKMQRGLEQQREIMEEFLVEGALNTDLRSDRGNKPKIFENFLWESLRVIPREYHPLEIVQWKYGSYLAADGKTAGAVSCWERAIEICGSNPDYTVMKVIRIAIQMEMIGFFLRKNEKRQAEQQEKKLRHFIMTLLEDAKLPVRMRTYAVDCQKILQKLGSSEDSFEVADACYREARKIAF